MKQEIWQVKVVLFALFVALIEPAVPSKDRDSYLPKAEGTEEPAEQD